MIMFTQEWTPKDTFWCKYTTCRQSWFYDEHRGLLTLNKRCKGILLWQFENRKLNYLIHVQKNFIIAYIKTYWKRWFLQPVKIQKKFLFLKRPGQDVWFSNKRNVYKIMMHRYLEWTPKSKATSRSLKNIMKIVQA